MAYAKEKEIAIAAVQAAAIVCEKVRAEMVPEAIEKSDKSPVTVADFGAQAIVCKMIKDAFPGDPIVGEEDADDLRTPDMASRLAQVTNYVKAVLPDATDAQIPDWIDQGNGDVSPRYWTLDPIDGTKGFLRGDQYAVALAMIEDGDIKVGVLGCPALKLGDRSGILFVAVRGEGALMMNMDGSNPEKISVTSSSDSEHFRFVESVAHGDQELHARIAQAAGITTESIRMDSQAKYGAVASGNAVLYLRLPSPKYPNYREKIWDHAAGVLVIEEAGGKVTDMHGKPLDFSKEPRFVDTQGVVVSNGEIHDQVLAALAS
ncbi:3'(2'),5'-bisphosphate nucleotidase [Leptolyngbya cf. ectocarpi LEGE 11479]|uniref:3'(2'),5'-bisphosphate nucleotidase n=1 Tax=Leptolyngbya cf. ectocarpi LEGE 11479 TaxID=1828722 RepID=A0A928WYZ3_LEPEC|nr:3'(2'),5'-bisphosphate nucleotidase [Leptolyngbya ectocarpi]MBE9066045.1 3'(2'),5'-bisphosphate nucleotidase [Leptolyngbya cf. ectocarpi LEGE 11479]